MEGETKKSKYILPNIKDVDVMIKFVFCFVFFYILTPKRCEKERQTRELKQVLWEVYDFDVPQLDDMSVIFKETTPKNVDDHWIGPYGIFVPGHLLNITAKDGGNILHKDGGETERGCDPISKEEYFNTYCELRDDGHYWYIDDSPTFTEHSSVDDDCPLWKHHKKICGENCYLSQGPYKSATELAVIWCSKQIGDVWPDLQYTLIDRFAKRTVQGGTSCSTNIEQ